MGGRAKCDRTCFGEHTEIGWLLGSSHGLGDSSIRVEPWQLGSHTFA